MTTTLSSSTRKNAGRLLGLAEQHRGLVFLLLVGAYSTVSYVLWQPDLAGDEGGYLKYAEALLNDQYWSDPGGGKYMWWGPGLPLLLAPFKAIGAPLIVLRFIFGPILLAGANMVVWSALDVDCPPRTATLGALAFSCYLPFSLSLGSFGSEPATVLFISSGLLMWLLARRESGLKYAVGAGVALGLAAVTRVEFGYVVMSAVVVSGAASLFRPTGSNAQKALAASLTALAVASPWLIYTHHVTGKVGYWGVSGGLSLYWTASAEPPEVGSWIDTAHALQDVRLKRSWPDILGAVTRTPAEADSYFQRKAISAAIDDPLRYARNLSLNSVRMVLNYPYSFKPFSPRALGYAIPNLLLLISILVVAIRLTARRRWRLVALAPIYVAVIDLAIKVPVASYARFVLPVVPILIWFVCRGVTILGRSEDAAPLLASADQRSSRSG
jgi:hypothetical protein